MADPINNTTVSLTISTAAGGTLALNDHVNYAVSATTTRESTSATYKRVEATSPVLDGTYLIHLTRDMVQESVQIYIFGTTQTQIQSNYRTLLAAFEQPSYTLTWTWADYTEHWTCNAITGATMDMSQVQVHAYQATATFQVPRFPQVF